MIGVSSGIIELRGRYGVAQLRADAPADLVARLRELLEGADGADGVAGLDVLDGLVPSLRAAQVERVGVPGGGLRAVHLLADLVDLLLRADDVDGQVARPGLEGGPGEGQQHGGDHE